MFYSSAKRSFVIEEQKEKRGWRMNVINMGGTQMAQTSLCLLDENSRPIVYSLDCPSETNQVLHKRFPDMLAVDIDQRAVEVRNLEYKLVDEWLGVSSRWAFGGGA